MEIIKARVTQDSILDPTLLLLFIIDLSLSIVSGDLILYSDDTTEIMKDSNAMHLSWCISQNLTSAQEWFFDNGLTLNSSDTNNPFSK